MSSLEMCGYSISKNTGQARVGLVHRGFSTKIGGLELFVKFKLGL